MKKKIKLFTQIGFKDKLEEYFSYSDRMHSNKFTTNRKISFVNIFYTIYLKIQK